MVTRTCEACGIEYVPPSKRTNLRFCSRQCYHTTTHNGMWGRNLRPREDRRQPLAERFWSKVDKSGECWLWTAALSTKGYGKFGISATEGIAPAHRVAWELTHGPIPQGIWVLHRCDVKPCVRPDHLFLGNANDNMQDAANKGRLWSQTDPTRWQRAIHRWRTV